MTEADHEIAELKAQLQVLTQRVQQLQDWREKVVETWLYRWRGRINEMYDRVGGGGRG